jgi:S-formylglutathione hydrolase FrmB
MRAKMPRSCIALVLLSCWSAAVSAEKSAPVISSATRDEHGFLVHEVESPYQAGKTQIRVLKPDSLQPGKQYPVVYVLPVEANNESRWGNGLVEVKMHDLHNKHQLIFVAPTFSHLPWYADHPTNLLIRQESYFLKVVVPYVESEYPALAAPRGRWLLGFSKSGWGAWSLLLRHPEVFGRAAAFDAPLMMDQLGKYGSTEIFGTQENFERYEIPGRMSTQASTLAKAEHFVLIGVGNFKEHHEEIHALMLKLQIPHRYRDNLLRKHDWHSGWVAEAVEWLGTRE